MASKYVTFEDLVRFHQEVIAPDLDRRMGAKLDAKLAPVLREISSLHDITNALDEKMERIHREVLTHFDDVYDRLNSMSIEYTALKGGLRRVEDRLSKLDGSTN